MSAVTTFAAGVPAPAGIFTGKASSGATDFMAVLATMTDAADETTTAPAEENTQEQAGAAPEAAASPETPELSTPYAPAPPEFRIPADTAAPAVPVTPRGDDTEPVAAAVAEPAEPDVDSGPKPAPAATAQATEESAVPTPAAVSQAAVQVTAASATPAAVGQVTVPAPKAPEAKASTAAAAPVAAAAAKPLEALFSLAGRPAVQTPVPAAATQQVAYQQSPQVQVRPRVFTVPEAVQAVPAETTAVPVSGAPAQAQTPAVNVSAPQAAAAPAPVQQPLHTQLAKPMFTLAAAGNGEHVMTMKVTPEDLGTVTVRAVIGPEGVRMELFAADAGREAVKAIMPELRRELAGAGLNASLDLGTGARPETSGGEGRQQRESRTTESDPRQGQREQPPARSQRMFTDRAASLDVLA